MIKENLNQLKIPNAFLVGAPKCGTTAISSYLSEHPNVFLPYPKEPTYWSFDLKGSDAVLKLNSFEQYMKLYKGANASDEILLDASTNYLLSEVAVKNIIDFNPEAKFIVMLRNPVDVAYAFHMEQLFNTFENEESFEKAWNLQCERKAGKHIPKGCVEPKNLQYLQIASLGSQLERLLHYVDKKNLHIIFHEDFANNPRNTYLSLLSFLGLKDDFRVNFEVTGSAHYNKYPKLALLYQNPPKPLGFLVRSLKKFLRVHLSKILLDKIISALIDRTPREKLDPNFRARLVVEFESETSKLDRITGRNLSHWKY